MKSITGANAVFQLSIADLFPTPVQLQGFAADDVFNTDPMESAETLMGVDGRLSGGFVYVPTKQNIILQADSDSNAIFDQWWQQQQANEEVYIANGLVLLKSLQAKYTLTKGFLTTYPPTPGVKKLAQPRTFSITWERISPSVA